MALEENEKETIEFLKDNMAIESKRAMLTEWEVNFIKDQLERYEKYGEETRFSVKQWAVIEKVEEAFQSGQRIQSRR
jgi:hypothetical protein